ncbi:hypothetical protein [Kitasatospora sp. NPDC002040]|uniref:hypothetical protein n=1 Tax=Kitasatospora sp. NPDC002040 TaxID=3154661 RepID=UPI003331257A
MTGTHDESRPEGHHQDLVDALQELHRAAGSLSSRKVSALIRGWEERLSEASHETVRSTINGKAIPRWETVHDIVVVLAGLCSPPRDADTESGRFLLLWRAAREGEKGALKSFQELANSGWGGEDGKWTPEMIMGILVNPFSAIQIAPGLAAPHEPVISEDEWIRAMEKFIEDDGAEHALRLLLHTLKGDYIGAVEGTPFGYQDMDREALDAYMAFQYGCREVRRRLRAEPNLLAESIRAMRADETMDRDDRAEMLENESDLALMREVMIVTPDTWDEVSEEAHHMVFGYLIKQIGPPGPLNLPDAYRFPILWRIPEPSVE